MTVPFPQDVPNRLTGAANQKADSVPTKLTQCLEIQRVIFERIMIGGTENDNLSSLARAWDVIEDRIRVLRGKVKAGSRNISVREGDIPKRISGPRASRPTDYLKDAEATLAAHEAAMKAMNQPPIVPPSADSATK